MPKPRICSLLVLKVITFRKFILTFSVTNIYYFYELHHLLMLLYLRL